MTKGGLSAEEAEKVLQQKLEALNEPMDDENYYFVQTFTMNLEKSPEYTEQKNHSHDEEAFQKATLEGVLKARELLEKNDIKYIRPPDNFVEMFRDEREMEIVRQKLMEDQRAIQIAEAKRKQKQIEQAPKVENVQKKPGILMKKKVSAAQRKKDAKKAMRAKSK
ncbi:hypothetical protein TVAG_467310 [Trichomonas vaginalis G3]|uniref:Uncharacterized protein n=1 Tax=Trichomonas vaginalis (strain ATCC PRA-98 / G3) TaxID=412133 RepID=A2FQD7_TRIV3|nr:rRNA processing protein EBNA1-binding protein-related family [Trichomonas vaginalis G3]EAX92884.1 hypothetical protein TVAG_467310 [Trichomonas vaginalis G3]KAI5494015.1 rRNA processing protein EBNA1-binding protein-related family [Trichomonas vaginalis G3]|eukprot:XP_001305814.1 hypothetical protein [Trichomonas vaginalis G3]